MKVLVCGGRDFCDRDRLFWELDRFVREHGKIDAIIHGEARGSDALAEEWASARSIWVIPFPADWKQFGNSAGPIRNRRMLVEGKPDFVIAFPGGNGTENMVRQSVKAGIPVIRA